jgi:hypothetical protein
MKAIITTGAAMLMLAAAPALAADSAGSRVQNAAKDASFSAIAGVDYSTGKYGGTERTDITLAPLGLQAKFGDFRLTGSIPYERISGPANVVGGADPGSIIVDPSKPTTRTTREGFGDASLALAYALPKDATGAYDIELSARVKFATASTSKGLGTGENDYGVSLDVSRSAGAWAPFVTVGYRFMGDPPGVDLRDTMNASVGTSLQLSDRYVAIFSYDYSQSTSRTLDDGHELFAAVNGPLSQSVSWTLYGVAGLSDGSPDAEGGLALTAKFR